FRSHLGVLAGAATAAAVLIGALAVGDSVRESLKQKALERTGAISFAIRGGDRFFRQELLFRGAQGLTASVLQLLGTAARQDGTARVNRVQILGVRRDFLTLLHLPGDGQSIAQRNAQLGQEKIPLQGGGWSIKRLDSPPVGSIALNASLAQALNASPGTELVIRIQKPSALSRDAVITPRDDQSVALRLKVSEVLPPGAGNFGLEANQTPPFTAWVDMDELGRAAGLSDLANLLVFSEGSLVEPKNGILGRIAVARWLPFRGRLGPWLEELDWKRAMDAMERTPVRMGPPTKSLERAQSALEEQWNLEDAELLVRARTLEPASTGNVQVPPFAELTTRRIFLEPAAVAAALRSSTNTTPTSHIPEAVPVLTYLVNSLGHGDSLTPYSLVTAAGPPYTPAGLRDDEIVINQWLADDLHLKPGDSVSLAYYRVDAGTKLVEHTNMFRVHSIVPLNGLFADRTLMPEFPGLAKAESTRDWDAGFDLVHTIRDQDEAYWKQWRGTPKAFITLAAGQKLWANRFGELTAIRWFPSLNSTNAADVAELRETLTKRIRFNLDPADVGLVWQPVREVAMRAATSGQDFGGLFIGFSFFLIVSALLLTAMLFQFSLEQRATETGILLALGWTPKRVRRLLFREGLALAALGTVIGAGLGAWYAKGVIWGLSTLWRDAVAGAGIEFHLKTTTLATGAILSLIVAAVTLAVALRRQARRPARELLNQGADDLLGTMAGAPRWIRIVAWVTTILGVGLSAMAWATRESNPETFFGAGALLLVAALLWMRVWLGEIAAPDNNRPPVSSLPALALRGLTRRVSRSLGTMALLASAAFLIVAVAANRLDATRNATQRNSGTGGFALWGETTLPIIQDLNSRKGQEFYGLESKELAGVSVVPFRVRDGDDASCLNLNRAQRPRLLAVNPEELARRGAFTFTKLASGIAVTNGWLALNAGIPITSDPTEVPAIGDANSIQWALGKRIGDTIDYVDERGQPFKVRLVGAVANSILQGSLVIAEDQFLKKFPSEGGYRVLLMDAPSPTDALSAKLSRALQDVGLELTPTTRRLNQFNSVQNTYLNTFQILGGLGLLLGSVGLGVVVLRNVFERRGELALMQAIGFSRSVLRRLVLTEHVLLLAVGLGLGVVAAGLAVLPSVLSPGAGIPWSSLAATLLLVLANGLLWTWLAVNRALRARLLDGLREL
ncbi:MAG TPA: hypothetical protein DCE44_12235, partial [Verrucomicrobiales bacterium]|nr:hypothetical protein [Verrucomicrobiales bacterium]